jgi:hypothetical protein
VHPVEPAEQCLTRCIADDGDQIEVADARLEITRRERAVDEQTHERRTGCVDDPVSNDADDRIGVRVGFRRTA